MIPPISVSHTFPAFVMLAGQEVEFEVTVEASVSAGYAGSLLQPPEPPEAVYESFSLDEVPAALDEYLQESLCQAAADAAQDAKDQAAEAKAEARREDSF